jgi:hypothetical protein
MAATAAVIQAKQKSSGRQPIDSLANLLEQTAQAFSKKLTPLEAEAILQSWTRLQRRFGRSAFESGLKCAIAELRFFPKLQELESRIPRVKLVGTVDPNCKVCEGTGWERFFGGLTVGNPDTGKRNPVDPKIGAVRRCQCWAKTEIA